MSFSNVVGADLESNAAHYLHLVEGFRPDLTLFSVNHMTVRCRNSRCPAHPPPDILTFSFAFLTQYEWWGTHHIPSYPHVKWPGRFYHPYKPGGFAIAQFFDANIDKHPIFVISGWKPGDESWKDHKKWHISQYGVGQRVLRASSVKSKLKSELDKSMQVAELKLQATAWPAEFDTINRAEFGQYDAGSWELRLIELLVSSRANVAFQLLSIATDLKGAEHSVLYRSIVSPAIYHLDRAVREMRNMSWVPSAKRKETFSQSYRNLGIAYDYAHKHIIAAKKDDFEGLSRKQLIHLLVEAWEMHMEEHPNDNAIKDAVEYWKRHLKTNQI